MLKQTPHQFSTTSMASLSPKKPYPLNQTKQLHGCPPPSPLTSQPVVLPPREPLEQHLSRSHVLRLVVTVLACMVAVVVFLFTVSLLIRYFYSRRYSRNQNRRDTPILFDVNGDDDVDEEELAVVHPIWYIRTVGLQQSLIDSITVFKYKKDDGIIDGTECSVCLGEFEHDESLRLLPKCSHAFHIPCIDTWLRSHKNCPLCRAPVIRDATEIRAVDQTEINVSDHQSQNQVPHGNVSDDNSGEDDHVLHSGISLEEETQGLRRSVSVDSFVVVDLDTHEENVNSKGKDNKGVSSCSSGGAMQKRTISMRRSFSHSSNFLFSRHSRSQSSTLPL